MNHLQFHLAFYFPKEWVPQTWPEEKIYSETSLPRAFVAAIGKQ